MRRNVPVHEETLSRCGSPGFPVAAFRSWQDAFKGAGGAHNRSPVLSLVFCQKLKRVTCLKYPFPACHGVD